MDGSMGQAAHLRVITGGGSVAGPGPALPLPPTLDRGPAEQAADLAELFAIGLVQDMALDQRTNPHCSIRIDPATRIGLHEVLCELRNLPWFDTALPQWADSAPCAMRQARRRNSAGQLTLRTLFNNGVSGLVPHGLSALLQQDHTVGASVAAGGAEPGAHAPMSAWLDWCARHSGAGLRLPGRDSDAAAQHGPAITTLRDLAEHVHTLPPARPFHNAVLSGLARGAAFDPGLPGWTGAQVFALMARAERRAARAALTLAGRLDRLSRPAVEAARLSVSLSLPQMPQRPAVADSLSHAAPNLLRWMNAANQFRRGPQRVEHSLFLPVINAGEMPMHPADTALHVTIGAALATVIKAVFNTTKPAQIHMVGQDGPDLALATEVDRTVSDYATARLVSGGYYPSENACDMQLGERIAIETLRDVMADLNRPAEACFTGFDGTGFALKSHARGFGRAQVELWENGTPTSWPSESQSARHLTAVV